MSVATNVPHLRRVGPTTPKPFDPRLLRSIKPTGVPVQVSPFTSHLRRSRIGVHALDGHSLPRLGRRLAVVRRSSGAIRGGT